MPPSCWFCQYAVKEETFNKPIKCTRHDFQVRTPLHAFCADLSNDEMPGLRSFIAEHQFDPTMMYQWIEVYYRGYYHEPVSVATLEKFATWPLAKQLQNIQELNRKKKNELEQLYGPQDHESKD
jgi:hypothetical protein